MVTFLLDDLNTPGMLGVLFESLETIKNDIETLCEVKTVLQQLVGLECKPLPESEVVITPEIEKLLQEREAARVAKDWARADQLRNELRTLGFEVQDKKLK